MDWRRMSNGIPTPSSRRLASWRAAGDEPRKVEQRPTIYKSRLLRNLRTLLSGYLLLLLLMMFLENYLIFPAPRYPQGDWDPVDISVEDVYFESADGTRLHGWYLDHPNPRCYLLYCHGNGEHVAYLNGLLQTLRDGLGLAVFAFDYRGYGRSEGSAHEAGVLQDGRAAHAWLAARAGIEPDDVVLMGRSLGGAVATDLAAHHGARGLVLESTFTSMPDVAARIYWWAPVRLLMRSQFNSLSKIDKYHGPLLCSHGTLDSLVPVDLGQRLFDAAPGRQKRFIEIAGGDHNDPQPREYYQALDRFLGGLAQPLRSQRVSFSDG
jgi:fermentation-respiration switch protein FrsA (DUF1100 family)